MRLNGRSKELRAPDGVALNSAPDASLLPAARAIISTLHGWLTDNLYRHGRTVTRLAA
jgi:hypothetical protein